MGRKRSRDPRYDTIQVRVGKEEMLLYALKSALYHYGNLSELIRTALSRYRGEIPLPRECGLCGGRMELSQCDLRYGQVEINGVPGFRCLKCGDVSTDLAVEEILEQMVSSRPPGAVEFETLLQG